MGFLKLFKSPSHQKFSYKPRYWDPKKEEAEERRQRVEELAKGGVDSMKTRISGGFRRGQAGEATHTYRRARVKQSNSTLIIVLVCLLALAYLGIVVFFPDLNAWLS